MPEKDLLERMSIIGEDGTIDKMTAQSEFPRVIQGIKIDCHLQRCTPEGGKIARYTKIYLRQ